MYRFLFTALLTCMLFNATAQHTEIGEASYYADNFHGKLTANGEIFDMNKVSAAHRTLPFGTIVKVTNLENGKSLNVRINDRGPFIKNRIIDLSKGAAIKLGYYNDGVTKVKIEVISNIKKDDYPTN